MTAIKYHDAGLRTCWQHMAYPPVFRGADQGDCENTFDDAPCAWVRLMVEVPHQNGSNSAGGES